MLAMAMAARNSGGIVIAEVHRLAEAVAAMRASGARGLIDHVYVDPGRRRPTPTPYSPYYAGAPAAAGGPPRRPGAGRAQDHRAPVAAGVPRRRHLHLDSASARASGAIAFEEGIADRLVLTSSRGSSRRPVAGNEGGTGFNYQAMIEQPSMFDFYDGGGLDVAKLCRSPRSTATATSMSTPSRAACRPWRVPETSAPARRRSASWHAHRGAARRGRAGRAAADRSEGALPKFVDECAAR